MQRGKNDFDLRSLLKIITNAGHDLHANDAIAWGAS